MITLALIIKYLAQCALKLPLYPCFVNDNVLIIIKKSVQIPASRKRFDIRGKEGYGPMLQLGLTGISREHDCIHAEQLREKF